MSAEHAHSALQNICDSPKQTPRKLRVFASRFGTTETPLCDETWRTGPQGPPRSFNTASGADLESKRGRSRSPVATRFWTLRLEPPLELARFRCAARRTLAAGSERRVTRPDVQSPAPRAWTAPSPGAQPKPTPIRAAILVSLHSPTGPGR